MSATKKCPNCGAENDLLFTNCLYCGSPLPEVDLNSISNEELLLNAGEWVGKVGNNFEHITDKYNEWTGKGKIVISANQIEGLSQKYLTLLQVRSLSNPNLMIAYQNLKKEFDEKRKDIFYKIGGGNKSKGMAFIFLIVSLIFIFFLNLFLILI